ncbi:acyl-CoA dehydratase activase [Chloroflexota bacterium]
MITAGVDVGIKTVKTVIVDDSKVVASGIALSNGFERGKTAEEELDKALKQAKLSASDVGQVIATGTGKRDVKFATNNVVEAVADVKGVLKLFPKSRTLIDMGAEQLRVVKYDENGKVANYTLNHQCGAGLGEFAEAMARALGVTLDEMSKLAAKSKGTVPVNGECGNYASMDIVTMIHDNTAKEDIAWAVLDAVANKIAATANLIDIDKDNIVLIGGLANNEGVVAALKRRMGVNFQIPEEAETAGALGAALIGASEA